ncbi:MULTISPECIES: type II toxin-antitoxin system RelE/ParE family toxin [unclassified Achromobacter]|uniref:type II toxin-antitoxin system RelE/ParE family toxin n=1 Tax=unclassified Achromobacter TaxID=2626865 RepID=UPI000B519CC2|nr:MULTISPECIES: type II toxin-antitoxin system RelE/ParE family toxin [unclassified Achromobacter]OWT71629.1 addiction module protein [Achromobacter sp. HZ34]OWT73286.1 addiction module protein [Achromobacter sp. HZ28]
MREIVSTEEFDEFEANLKDVAGRARIQARIRRLAEGNPGSHRNLKHGVTELKIDVGPGYRVYYTLRQDGSIVILLAGGDKSTQNSDIERAYKLVSQL